MLARLRCRLTYANVMATIAVFLGLGGSAYAVATITGADVVDESLTGADVRGQPGTSTTPAVNGSLTTDDIAGQQANPANGTPVIDGTLTQFDIKNNSLTGSDIAEPTLAKVPDADKLDGIDSTKLVSGGSFGGAGGQVSYNRTQLRYPATAPAIHGILAVAGYFPGGGTVHSDFGAVVGRCDENGIRIGFLNNGPDAREVYVDDAGSPPAWNAIAAGEVVWAPYHNAGGGISTATTTFQVASGTGNDNTGGGERVANVWASGRITPPEGSQCIFQAQALSQVG